MAFQGGKLLICEYDGYVLADSRSGLLAELLSHFCHISGIFFAADPTVTAGTYDS